MINMKIYECFNSFQVCIGETFMPSLGLEALDFLALNHNLLSTLSASHFEGLPRLSSLELDYNKIAKIDSAAFKGLESKKARDI